MTPLLWIGGVLVVTLVVCITIIDTTLKKLGDEIDDEVQREGM